MSQLPPSPASPTVDMKYLIRALIKYSASDLHLKAGRPPLYRINGKVIPAKMPELTAEQLQGLVFAVLSRNQKQALEEKRQIDFSFAMEEQGRFRCNIYYERGNVSAAIRMVPMIVPRLDDLGLPPILKELCQRPRGLLLVTGATGCGKSTTLAAMVQHLNETSYTHILAIEDPIEFVFRDMKAAITQREVGSDVHSLQEGLYGGLRQDPDVIMLGELRDGPTIQTALTAAETGHLVLATLHTNDARGTIDRIVDVFPSEAKNQVRVQLASTLVGVVSQQLISRADGSGRVCATEIMVKSPIIEQYILKDQLDRIPEAIANSNSYYNMQSMNQTLHKLVNAGTITLEEALRGSTNPDDLKLMFSGFSRDQDYQPEDSSQKPKISIKLAS